MGLLDGRIAVVTGSGRGIGRAIAECVAAEGASVVVNDIGCSVDGRGTQADPAAQVCKDIENRGGTAVPSYDDVSQWDSAAALIDTAISHFGKIDILINCAGILRTKFLLETNEDDFDAVVAVHLKGTFNTVRHAAPHMREQGYGRIINLSSGIALWGVPRESLYAAAKMGIIGLTQVAALELAQFGITANVMCPVGFTRMTEGYLFPEGDAPPGTEPQRNAAMVAYLASDRAAHVNGQIFELRLTGDGYDILGKHTIDAEIHKPEIWTPTEVADIFDSTLAPAMTPCGPAGLEPMLEQLLAQHP